MPELRSVFHRRGTLQRRQEIPPKAHEKGSNAHRPHRLGETQEEIEIMNAERRKLIAKAIEKVADLITELRDIESSEQEAFDAMPESLQNAERGEQSQTAIDTLQSATGNLESAQSDLEGIE